MTTEPALAEAALYVRRVEDCLLLVRARMALAGVPEDLVDLAIEGYCQPDHGRLSDRNDLDERDALLIGWAFRRGELHATALAEPFLAGTG